MRKIFISLCLIGLMFILKLGAEDRKPPLQAAREMVFVYLDTGTPHEGLKADGAPPKPTTPTAPPTQTLTTPAALPPDMVLVPAGDFMMGCNASMDNECYGNEKPQHKVYLDAYYIDKYEVTVDKYKACVKAGRCSDKVVTQWSTCNYNKSNHGNHPINCIDWNQAKVFCEYAGKRLPTEAEWEKAARGTDGRKYPWGNQQASCIYSVISEGGMGCGMNSTWPVGSKPLGISPYGAMDMAGNVREWTADWYNEKYYSRSPSSNPKGPDSGMYRSKRGGSWNIDPPLMRVSNRGRALPEFANNGRGVRCVRTP